MGRKMNNYIVVDPIKILNVGDELLAHYSYRIPNPRYKAWSLKLRDDQNVIILRRPKPKNKNKYIIDVYEWMFQLLCMDNVYFWMYQFVICMDVSICYMYVCITLLYVWMYQIICMEVGTIMCINGCIKLLCTC